MRNFRHHEVGHLAPGQLVLATINGKDPDSDAHAARRLSGILNLLSNANIACLAHAYCAPTRKPSLQPVTVRIDPAHEADTDLTRLAWEATCLTTHEGGLVSIPEFGILTVCACTPGAEEVPVFTDAPTRRDLALALAQSLVRPLWDLHGPEGVELLSADLSGHGQSWADEHEGAVALLRVRIPGAGEVMVLTAHDGAEGRVFPCKGLDEEAFTQWVRRNGGLEWAGRFVRTLHNAAARVLGTTR